MIPTDPRTSTISDWLDHIDGADRPDDVGVDFLKLWADVLSPLERARVVFPLAELLLDTGPLDLATAQSLAWKAADWLVRTATPTWLRSAGQTTHADALAGLPALVSQKESDAALSTVVTAAQAVAGLGETCTGIYVKAWAEKASAIWPAREAARAKSTNPFDMTLDISLDISRRCIAWFSHAGDEREILAAVRPVVLALQASAAELVKELARVARASRK